MPGDNRDEDPDALRPLLFAIAYRMLASVAEAEDVVQEAFLRYERARAQGTRVESTRAFLATVTTRLAVDELRSARARREAYVGTWLPEPLVTDTTAPVATADPADVAVSSDTLSMAFLLVLERLSPVERAAFLLHDVFGYEHAEVADVLGRSEAACRQLVSRARRHVRDDQPRFDVAADERTRIGEQFFAAVREGDVDGLVAVLADDAVVQGDSGGRSPSWPKVIVGRDKVARLMSSVGEQARQLGVQFQNAEVNGQPGAVVTDADGAVVNVLSLDVVDGRVQAVRSVINPDKVTHLGRLADVPGLAAQLRRHRRND